MTTGLTSLSLDCVILQPRQAQQGGGLGTSQLLLTLVRLTALQELTLHSIKGDWLQQLAPHSALTASSNLRELDFSNSSIPGAAWAHVFPACRQLPQLVELSAGRQGDHVSDFDSAGILSLVRCCPALEDVNMSAARGASLAPFTSLTALTLLSLACSMVTATNGHLATLTQLRELFCTVEQAPGMQNGEEGTAYGLQHLVPLTALTGLAELYCAYFQAIPEEEEQHEELLYLSDKVRVVVRRPAYCSAFGGLPQRLRDTLVPVWDVCVGGWFGGVQVWRCAGGACLPAVHPMCWLQASAHQPATLPDTARS
jgi:hypothetical protein